MTEFRRESWRLSGPLTAREVPQRYAESLAQWRREGLPLEIDLGGVENTDSSALALMLEWLSWARRAGSRLDFRNPPDSLRVIAGLSDADGLLGWAEEPPEE